MKEDETIIVVKNYGFFVRNKKNIKIYQLKHINLCFKFDDLFLIVCKNRIEFCSIINEELVFELVTIGLVWLSIVLSFTTKF